MKSCISEKKFAYSVVELTITLIIVACIMAAYVPVMTKKITKQLSSNSEKIMSISYCYRAFGTKCSLCTQNKCTICLAKCGSNQYVNTDRCYCVDCASTFPNCNRCNYSNCLSCNPGYGYTVATNSCSGCLPGQYSNGLEPCTDCSAGHFCPAPSLEQYPCPYNTYQSQTRQVNCIFCAGALPASTSCTPITCAAGEYLPTNATHCSYCPCGTYSSAGATSCTDCPDGTYSNSRSSSCTTVGVNYYTNSISGRCSNSYCGDGYTSPGGTGVCSPSS